MPHIYYNVYKFARKVNFLFEALNKLKNYCKNSQFSPLTILDVSSMSCSDYYGDPTQTFASNIKTKFEPEMLI